MNTLVIGHDRHNEEVRAVSAMFTIAVSCEDGKRLKCYNCLNLLDPKCGTTWGYGPGEEEHLVECPEGSVSCRKLEYRDDLQGKDSG